MYTRKYAHGYKISFIRERDIYIYIYIYIYRIILKELRE